METREFGAALESSMVNCLENADVDATGTVRIERKLEHGEDVSESLNAYAKRTMVPDRILGGLAGVIGYVDEFLEVAHNDFDDGV